MKYLQYFELCVSFVNVFLYISVVGFETIDTTLGFVSKPLNESNFIIQKPYDVPLEQRYSYSHGVHKLWVIKTDKPHSETSNTNPRSEIRIQGYDYSSGVWQFEAYGYVPCGTTGVSIMQVFGSAPPNATTTMLRVYNSSLYYYKDPMIIRDLYNKWFRFNVIHDVEQNNVKVYVDGVLKYEGCGHGGTSHYFKCGVYTQDHASFYMESRWKNIRVLEKYY
ncbi:citrate-binding protein [Lactuca sativa]|uniref:Alginate lyase 2 domain-containing protein n=1 Tax=Lactuca sativa TaxID=4236 RepID=A0A9R1VZH2_LACSA|nr:citrate-binding protein [Lactuca sativa]KAJ0215521.1 hypothetical protein LSAT_V11C300126400 [Lactuca sativa]